MWRRAGTGRPVRPGEGAVGIGSTDRAADPSAREGEGVETTRDAVAVRRPVRP